MLRQRRRVAPRGAQRRELRIVSLNVNGLRQGRKITASGTFRTAQRPQPDTCTLVETHPFGEETGNAVVETCREASAGCRKHEVLTVAKMGLGAMEATGLRGAPVPLRSSSILVFLGEADVPAVRVTGLYVPPSAGPTDETMKVLTDSRPRRRRGGRLSGRVIGWGINHPQLAERLCAVAEG